MEIAELIAALSKPSAYPQPVGTIEVRQTHISVVFLTAEHAYKIKKPVALGFLDFSTLEKRRFYCHEEVRLNRRLAPAVYVGVVPITRAGDEIRLEGAGEIVEWAVKMQRLPDDATLLRRLEDGLISPQVMEALARRLSDFHARADSGAHIALFGRWDVVARNARENFEQSFAQLGTTVSQAVYERLRQLTDEALTRLGSLIAFRADQFMTRDTHGDLRLDHVYLFPDRTPPDDLVVIDCIEFNERFRFADPVADMAFLEMDLLFHGHDNLAGVFADAYFRASGDAQGRVLLPFYTAYRALVRAKVDGITLAEQEIPQAQRTRLFAKACAHWLLALGQLAAPGQKPCLLLVAGLPGTGKSTLAGRLAEQAGFQVIRSDVVRKELAGVPATAPSQAGFGQDLYTPRWSERTYAECLRRAQALLFEGRRVLVDANFRDEARRRMFLDFAAAWAVPAVLLVCEADPETIRTRLQTRLGDASDADWSIYQQAAAAWQPPGERTRQRMRQISTNGTRAQGDAHALDVLRQLGLHD